MAVRSCIPPVSTLPHGGQIVHSTSQHTTTWWSVNTVPHGGQIKPFHQSAHYHMVVRSCIPPVSTLPHGGQIKPLHQPTHYHMVVRSCIPPVSTLPHGGQLTQCHMAVRSNHSTSQRTTTWWSDQTIPPVSTLPHGGQIVHSTSQHSTTLVVRWNICEGRGGLFRLAVCPNTIKEGI